MEIKQKELIAAYFKMLSQNLFGGAKEKKHWSQDRQL
jgi:hypothetical protein